VFLPVLCASFIFKEPWVSDISKNKKIKIDGFRYLKKIRIKEPAGSGYFENCKIKELPILGISKPSKNLQCSWDGERLSMNEI
jgi:hypothetical protein